MVEEEVAEEDNTEEAEEEGDNAPVLNVPTIGPLGNPYALSEDAINAQFSSF